MNYSTTDYVRGMLASLLDQSRLDLLGTIAICDNNSKDGGRPFLRALEAASDKVVLTRNAIGTSHARGVRIARRSVQRAEAGGLPPTNIWLHVDPDVQFLRRDFLADLAEVFTSGDVAYAGEYRGRVATNIQASLLAVRRDWAARPGVAPWINDGAPARRLQERISRLGRLGQNLPSYAIHRGRGAVAAAREFHPMSSYAAVSDRQRMLHFMHTPGGGQVWQDRWESLASLRTDDRALVTAVADALA